MLKVKFLFGSEGLLIKWNDCDANHAVVLRGHQLNQRLEVWCKEHTGPVTQKIFLDIVIQMSYNANRG